ncbi:hypothetical protein [Sinomicrobium sp. M5D2P9]
MAETDPGLSAREYGMPVRQQGRVNLYREVACLQPAGSPAAESSAGQCCCPRCRACQDAYGGGPEVFPNLYCRAGEICRTARGTFCLLLSLITSPPWNTTRNRVA